MQIKTIMSSPHTSQNGYQKSTTTNAGEGVEKVTLQTLLVGM